MLNWQALEEPARRHGAADAISVFCAGAKFDFQEHVPSLITVSIAKKCPCDSLQTRSLDATALTVDGGCSPPTCGQQPDHAGDSPLTLVMTIAKALVPLFVEPEEATLLACWEALGTVTGTIPKDLLPSYVPVLKEAVATAREKVRRTASYFRPAYAGRRAPVGYRTV